MTSLPPSQEHKTTNQVRAAMVCTAMRATGATAVIDSRQGER